MSKMELGHIAIIGGGPGGLTLARILQLKDVEVKIYERETSIDVRSQGGTLDLHVNTGQHALQVAQLFDKFQTVCRPEGEDLRIVDKSGKVHHEKVAEDNNFGRPEIDRGDLRQLFLDSLKPNTILQGYNLQNIESLGNGQHKLVFDNGVTEIADLVIGADGAWSRVRPLLSNAKPEYCGVTFVEIQFSDVDDRHPDISKLVGRGSLFALSDNKGLTAQRNTHNRIRVYISLRVPENWVDQSGIDFNQPEQARNQLLQLFPDWDDQLLDLIRLCDDIFIPRPLYMLPIDHKWETQPGITLLGDAAHLMSPFGAEGANLAMLDGAELALAITNSNNLTEAIKEYEQNLFTRSIRAAHKSARSLDLCISSGNSAEKLGQAFKDLARNRPPKN